VQQRAARESVGTEAVQDRTVEAGELRDRRVGVQRVAVAAEAVQQRLVVTSGVRDLVIIALIGELQWTVVGAYLGRWVGRRIAARRLSP